MSVLVNVDGVSIPAAWFIHIDKHNLFMHMCLHNETSGNCFPITFQTARSRFLKKPAGFT